METKYYFDMLERTIVGTGNNYRMKKVIQKAGRGEDVTLVYLGASITKPWRGHDPKGYVALSYEDFKNRFGKSDNVHLVNSGMNGTTSTIGLIRVERDLLLHEPDVVFIDFAVNDMKDGLQREIFESLILRILKSKSNPAVVLMFMVADTGYTCQGHMQVIGEHYSLPMISVSDGIFPEIDSGRMTWRDYSDDNIHPNLDGNGMIADMIAHYFDRIEDMEEQEELELPQKCFFGDSFVSMRMLDSRNINMISLGDFTQTQTLKEFEYGWIHQMDSANERWSMKITCKYLFLLYKEDKGIKEGNAQIHVDGELKYMVSGYRIFGWNNPVAQLILREEETAEHIIEICMAPEDVNKEFTLLGFGYCV